MENSDCDVGELKTQVQILKENAKFSEERLRQKEQELKETLFNLGRKESELRQTIEEQNKLKIELAVANQKLKYEIELRSLLKQNVIKKTTVAKFQAFMTSLLFLVSSLLVGFGINFLTGTPPNSTGWILIAFAGIVYVIAALLTTLLAGGEQ